MPKTINVDAYKLIKKSEETSMYDILLCNVCLQTCLRCNYSRHKKSPKHLRELEKEAIPIIEIKEFPSHLSEPELIYVRDTLKNPTTSGIANQKTFFLLGGETEDKKIDNNDLLILVL